MRASRLLSILILLQLRGRMTADALAAEFEVSARTIHRDIDQLSAAGVPIYAERGRLGGFALLDGYRTRLTGMTRAESDALVLSGAGRVAQDLGMGAELTAAQLKLLAALPSDAGASAQRVAARFHLDPVDWYRRADAPARLPQLAEAVWDERRLALRYESWRGEVEREVDPLGLVLKGGAWYLVAAVADQPRTYRVSNILDLSVVDGPVRRPKGFDLAGYWTEWAAAFEAKLMAGRAEVVVSPAGRRLLRDIAPTASAALEAAWSPAEPEGWVRGVIPVEPAPDAVRQILRLGAEIEVIGPPELRSAVGAEARRIVERHDAR